MDKGNNNSTRSDYKLKQEHLDTPSYSRDIYSTSPSYIQLCRMTSSELSNVADFKIWNKYGKIDFQAPVDLRFAFFFNLVLQLT